MRGHGLTDSVSAGRCATHRGPAVPSTVGVQLTAEYRRNRLQMSSTAKRASVGDVSAQLPVVKKSRGHTRPSRPVIDISGPGHLRVAHLLALFGISHSALYARIRDGRFPPKDGKDGPLP